jgi:hypothetical protein
MSKANEIPPFPNPGVRLIKEDAHVAVWEEVFEPGDRQSSIVYKQNSHGSQGV